MKIGLRSPSIKSSIKARTTGKIKRDIKRAVNPLYGKNGLGMITDPKKALYNKIYKQTTIGVNYNLRTRTGKECHEYESFGDFLSDVDIDSITMIDIDEMSVDALEVIYSANQNKELSKENKKKLDRIETKIVLGDIIPSNAQLPECVKTKSGKSRHDYPSDFRYLADLDLATIPDDYIDKVQSDMIKAIYDAKNTSWKRKEEKSIWKKIKQRYIQDC